VFLGRYELDLYSPEDGNLHSHRRENLNPYIALTELCSGDDVSPLRYQLGSYIPEDAFFTVTAVKISNLT
jgi:hypothetical protein